MQFLKNNKASLKEAERMARSQVRLAFSRIGSFSPNCATAVLRCHRDVFLRGRSEINFSNSIRLNQSGIQTQTTHRMEGK